MQIVESDRFVPRQPGQPQLTGYIVTVGEQVIPVAALDTADAERIATTHVRVSA